MTFLDFGLVKRFTPEDTAALFAIVRSAVIEPDAAALRVAIERAGFIAPIRSSRRKISIREPLELL